jgi:hypothetical protein
MQLRPCLKLHIKERSKIISVVVTMIEEFLDALMPEEMAFRHGVAVSSNA